MEDVDDAMTERASDVKELLSYSFDILKHIRLAWMMMMIVICFVMMMMMMMIVTIVMMIMMMMMMMIRLSASFTVQWIETVVHSTVLSIAVLSTSSNR